MPPRMLNAKYVPSEGPATAAVLWMGEAPWRREAIDGRPFAPSGATGKLVRAGLTAAGLRVDRDVRIANAISHTENVPDEPAGWKPLVEKYRKHVEDELALCRPRVVVACGGIALYALTGQTSIEDAHGGVSWFSHPRWPNDALLIPCLHPAGVMKTKLQAGRAAIAKVIARVAGYANGTLRFVEPEIDVWHNPDFESIDIVFENAKVIAVDTEFDPTTHEPLSVQLCHRPGQVVIVDGMYMRFERVTSALRRVLARKDCVKVAHSHTADVETLLRLGIDVPGPWVDTMGIATVLYPDLPCGLSWCARFWFDDACDWKQLPTMDERYRALDAHWTRKLYDAMRVELVDTNIAEVYYDETAPVIPLLWGMEERGLKIDADAQRGVVEALTAEGAQLREEIAKDVYGMETSRASALKLVADDATTIVEGLRTNVLAGKCEVHPAYDGLRKKRWAKDERCVCATIYDSTAALRAEIAAANDTARKLAVKAERWAERGFDPGNNHDLRWLLYGKDGLALRPVRDPKTGKPTAKGDAVKRLIARLGPGEEWKAGLLQRVKRYQHVEKVLNTFAQPPVDANGVAHPPYNIRTGTGRVAGGDDASDNDVKGESQYSYNTMNVPKEIRRIFVP